MSSARMLRGDPRIFLAIAALSMAACAAKQQSHAGAQAASPSATAEPRTANAGAQHLLQVRVTSCVPVGYGVNCSCEIDSTREHGKLESCVGTGLYRVLEKAPLVGAPAAPLPLRLDTEPATDADRYCGVLVLDSGQRLRVRTQESGSP